MVNARGWLAGWTKSHGGGEWWAPLWYAYCDDDGHCPVNGVELSCALWLQMMQNTMRAVCAVCGITSKLSRYGHSQTVECEGNTGMPGSHPFLRTNGLNKATRRPVYEA